MCFICISWNTMDFVTWKNLETMGDKMNINEDNPKTKICIDMHRNKTPECDCKT